MLVARAAPVTDGGGDSGSHAFDAVGSQIRLAWCNYEVDLLDKEQYGSNTLQSLNHSSLCRVAIHPY